MSSSIASLLFSALLGTCIAAQESDSKSPLKTPKSADELFSAFAKDMNGLECRFSEEKHLSLLALPLESHGRLYFMKPGYLARHVEAPSPSKVLVTPEELIIEGPKGKERIDLRERLEVRDFVTSLVQVFLGNAIALRETYDIAFSRDEERETKWHLSLTPRKKPLNELIRDIRLTGSGFEVDVIEVRETNGDRSVTRIIDADPKRNFSDEERLELFGISRP